MPRALVNRTIDVIQNSQVGHLSRTLPSLLKILGASSIPLGEKKTCWRFYFSGGGAWRLFATLPRSGWHFSVLVLNVALDLHRGGTGEYLFVDPANRGAKGRRSFFVPGNRFATAPLDWRTGRGQTPWIPASPTFLQTHMPFYRNTCIRTRDMKTVVLVRNVWDVIDSLINHYRVTPEQYDSFVGLATRRGNGPEWYDCGQIAKFYNSWGTVLHRTNVMAVRYEELMENPAREFLRITDFLEIDVGGAETLEAAVRLCSKEENQKRLDAAGVTRTRRVRFGDKRSQLTDHQRDHVVRLFEKSRYDQFGYSLDER